ncbi:hypothetical protein VB776_06475 [Arcicella sp. DC2W]|uniref:HTH cro/C1-type domain-containing protein n=1 Tax=Arcicella gelida TaxID=2984195 RepID=A0ABU5S2C9_9BACT|nr:hypothetical protein [Arcicella sp. DC2W]MEA5402551.1 hypothetical protein [Arcicella sp. DC2W]
MNKSFRETRLLPIVQSYEKKLGFTFKPNKTTYERLGINRKRLGMLLSGDAKTPLTSNEISVLSKFFGVTANEFFNQ